jgi:hypothetical protein
VALVWLVLILLVAVPSASAAPVQLLPASGTAGTHATVVASELPPRSEVELKIGNGDVKRLRASSAGVVTTRERIPPSARGRVPVSLKDARGDRALLHYDVRSRWAQAQSFASADWRGRVANIAANLERGRLVVAVDVRGLLPEERVSARFAGRRVARATAGPRGRATLHAALPQEATGRHLVVRGRRVRLTSTLPTPPATAVVAADIACKAPYETYEGHCEHAEVAELAQSLDPDVILIPGDIQYDDGTLSEFRRSFDLSWGQLEIPLRPTPGNHEYRTAGAAGYYDYFEMQSGWRPPPWYAFTLGDWRFISLNSNCDQGRIDCGPESEQEQWLRANLEAEPHRCTLAYWHHPRYSSGFHGSDPRTASIWRTLDQAGAELVLTGHDHHYERFALQDENGQQSDGGMREFVVGTGGSALSVVRDPRAPHTQYAQNREFGVLRLGLYADVYTWKFIGLNGRTMDKGVGGCFD